jgi:hypothetical protein
MSKVSYPVAGMEAAVETAHGLRTGFPPQAFLIGAQKAGTTSLAYILDRHPSIAVSEPKETYFFTQHWGRGLDWYRRQFQQRSDCIFLDATPGYSMAPPDGFTGDPTLPTNIFRSDVPKRIHSVSPDARFIYLLRNPVARTYSAYWHRVRAGNEHRPFRQALAEDVYYLSASDYEWQIRKYLEYFPIDRFLFLLFEDFVQDPQAASRQCCEFLGLPEIALDPAGGAQRNITYTYSGVGKFVTKLLPHQGLLEGVTRAVRTLVPERGQDLIRRLMTKKVPKISDEDRAYLAAHFAGSLDRLERLTGLSVAAWR